MATKKTAAEKAETKPYDVLIPLRLDGDDYAPGDEVLMTDAAAEPLLGSVVTPKAAPAA
ncbi:hypothetical protein [Pelomonas aquatica]|jgi:hypothetical protein|uniref:hypothetical protein n=1 Tax=Pelomonas aquatica TaxID=431058 RepID=UPI00227CCE3D|nr:hypothetical protein [Pelomonas aquatica]MCY4753265.1 hypothetical protein [Pelomonas aquatica]